MERWIERNKEKRENRWKGGREAKQEEPGGRPDERRRGLEGRTEGEGGRERDKRGRERKTRGGGWKRRARRVAGRREEGSRWTT